VANFRFTGALKYLRPAINNSCTSINSFSLADPKLLLSSSGFQVEVRSPETEPSFQHRYQTIGRSFNHAHSGPKLHRIQHVERRRPSSTNLHPSQKYTLPARSSSLQWPSSPTTTLRYQNEPSPSATYVSTRRQWKWPESRGSGGEAWFWRKFLSWMLRWLYGGLLLLWVCGYVSMWMVERDKTQGSKDHGK